MNQRSSTISDAILGLLVIAILGVMIIPVPQGVIDILLSFNIVFSIIILLVVMYITTPLELSVFPRLLSVATVFRLSLNVATTRLILGQADAGRVDHLGPVRKEHLAGAHADTRIALRCADQGRQPTRFCESVIVERGHVATVASPDALVDGCGEADVGLVGYCLDGRIALP